MTADRAPCLTPQVNGGDATPSRAAQAERQRRVPGALRPAAHEADCLRHLSPQRRRCYRLFRPQSGQHQCRRTPAAPSPRQLRPDRRNGRKGPQPQRSLTECRPSCWLAKVLAGLKSFLTAVPNT
ncbi:hypothetical protein NDU88_005033 [Pleurodeles waltl]|uniref:Uncharacterized protein n=1 Tax=Pleurodeles waltl TaxID=8319 RepID=A0AAV7T9F9_PLEWA|nr:hypothetical protein NDU88_005033 [Pleurodeles waltl]